MELPAVGCLCSDCRCCFVFAVTLLKILVKKFSFYAKITMAVIGIIVGVAALFIGTLFPQFQSLLVDETYTREKFAASAVTNRLPADAFQRLEKLLIL